MDTIFYQIVEPSFVASLRGYPLSEDSNKSKVSQS